MITENLSREEAIQKMIEIAETIKIAMLLTKLNSTPVSVNPMELRRIDNNGTIYFLSGLDSDHNSNIQQDKRSQLIFSHPSEMLYLSLYGTASLSTDAALITDLYTKEDDKWFEGNNDPNLSVIKFIPHESYYWDKRQNKFVQFLRQGTEAITGIEGNSDTKGKLDI